MANHKEIIKNWYEQRKLYWQPIIALLVIALIDDLLVDALTIKSFILTMGIDQSHFIEKTQNMSQHQISALLGWSLDYLSLFLFILPIIALIGGWRHIIHQAILLYVGYGLINIVLYVFLLITLTLIQTEIVSARDLLWNAVLIWIAIILVFSALYWLIDNGGVHQRHQKRNTFLDFVFPQQMLCLFGWERWVPGFIDYIYIAFTISTSFNPNETIILSKRVKILSMFQASLSFGTIAMLISHAVDILS